MKNNEKIQRIKEIKAKLDKTVEVYEERLKIVEELLIKYTEANEIELITNYLLFGNEEESGAELEHKIYYSDKRMAQKHYKSSSLDLELENGEVEFNRPKKNYLISKEVKYKNLDLNKLINENESIRDYENLLKYVNDNNVKGVTKSWIKEDITDIADRHTIRFKAPLSPSGVEVDLDLVEYNKNIIKYLLFKPKKEVYDLNNTIDVIEFDFINLIESIKFTDKQRTIIEYLQKDHSLQYISKIENIPVTNIDKRIDLIIEKVLKNISENTPVLPS